MATLTPEKFCSVADGGHVQLDVDPTPHGDAELYERIVPFRTTATSSTPPFRRVPVVFVDGAPARHTVDAPVGSLYQARLYPRGSIPAGQQPTDRDRPIGTVDLPCVFIEARENGLLTRCRGDRAQLRLDVGDIWLGATLGTGGVRTRMLLLVGAEAPAETWVGTGLWPRFGERTPLAAGSSARAGRLHRVYAPPHVLLPEEDGIDPRQTVHYVAVVWTADGRWDYVWADDGVGGTGAPQAVVTRTREISAKVTRIACIDDSFENDFGIEWQKLDVAVAPDGSDDGLQFDVIDDDGLFDLVLKAPGFVALARHSYLWEDVDDGEVVTPPHLEFDWSGGAEAHAARIYLGSGACSGEVDVPVPAGEGVRSSTHQLRITGEMAQGVTGFYADLTVTVGYS